MAQSRIGNSANLTHENSVSIEYFKKCLSTAKECEDKLGQRRAHVNLGLTYLKFEDFDQALFHYREASIIGESTNDELFLAQVYFIIACIHHLKQDYRAAIYFHEKHLNYAQKLQDTTGQCQAYLLLSQLYDKISQYDKGKKFQSLYAALKRVMKADEMKSASKNKLNKNLRAESITLTLTDSHPPESSRSHSALPSGLNSTNKKSRAGFIQNLTKKPIIKTLQAQSASTDTEELVEVVHRMQNTRLDDQRCEMRVSPKDKNEQCANTQIEDIWKTIDRLQKFRFDDQRTSFRRLTARSHSPSDESFFDQLAKCQDSRLDDQRAVLLPIGSSIVRPVSATTIITPSSISIHESISKTLPSTEFLSLFNRLQAHYHEEQIFDSSWTKQTDVNI
ncbi:unnamed protein product [Adineta ricciae]|uniref:Uncharacterized protein n=1 Tax=Adineta ricciae TaxID=249248 RepID=A0A815UP61_ADIRI|nr:unnamed protein product [Adineta ricciae]